jgi:hypothetical protein
LICIPYPIFVGSKIEKNEMDGVSGAQGEGERYAQGTGGVN